MAKIISRPTEDNMNLEILQEIVEAASLGAIGKVADGADVDIATDMPGLLQQTDVLFASLLEALEISGFQLAALALDKAMVQVKLDVAEDMLERLIGDISYDEAMDHATMDLMDCFASSGAADVTADGELEFDERITFSKEDLKPMLREAIVKWVELKLSQ